MDIFSRLAKETKTDFRVFKNIQKANSNEAVKDVTEFVQSEEKQKEEKKVQNPEIIGKKQPEKTDEKVIYFKQPENSGEEAAIKLETELETSKSVLLPVFPIVRYLKNKCMVDLEFAGLVNNEKKTLKKCFRYVEGEVKKALSGSNGWLDDNEVYSYAEIYYITDEAVFEKIEAEKQAAEMKRREEVEKMRKEQLEKQKKSEKRKENEKKENELDSSSNASLKTKDSNGTSGIQEQLSLL